MILFITAMILETNKIVHCKTLMHKGMLHCCMQYSNAQALVQKLIWGQAIRLNEVF